MTLSELKTNVDDAVQIALEMGEDPAKVPITLQLDQQVDGSIWSAEQVELFYDGGAQCTGCLISAYLPENR
jgi:hypothetical protein